MRLRKSYKVKRGKKKYDYISCPDSDLDRNTTKLIHQCKGCEFYHGVLDDISGKYIRCDYSKPRARIDKGNYKEMDDTRFYVNKRLMWRLKHLNIHPDEFEQGLGHVKGLAKKRMRERLHIYHPDTTELAPKKAKRELKKLIKSVEEIEKLKLTPPTDETFDKYVEMGGKI